MQLTVLEAESLKWAASLICPLVRVFWLHHNVTYYVLMGIREWDKSDDMLKESSEMSEGGRLVLILTTHSSAN